jgi:hypothetical protein
MNARSNSAGSAGQRALQYWGPKIEAAKKRGKQLQQQQSKVRREVDNKSRYNTWKSPQEKAAALSYARRIGAIQ